MNTEAPTPIADLDEARRIVKAADDALAALPAARSARDTTVEANRVAEVRARVALDRVKPLYQSPGDALDEAYEDKEAAMRAMYWVNEIAWADVLEVRRLDAQATSEDVTEARRIVASADDLVVLRKVAGVGAVVETPASRRFM